MMQAKAENKVVSFSSFAERAARKMGTTGLQARARMAIAQGQKEAFLEELSGYVDEVLGNRALLMQRVTDSLPVYRHRPIRNLRVLQGGKG